jgi:hypothetical protein
MRPASLLRWYPRAWRDRYGEELLALIQDTLDEGRPAWRLRAGVASGGLRERGRQARRAAAASVRRRPGPDRWGTVLVAGLVCAVVPGDLASSSFPARAGQAVALGAVLAAVALTGALVLAGGLAALPALVRFVRAGGWPKIRRRAGWAAGATAAAGGGLAGLVLASGSRPPAQVNTWGAYWTGLLATGLATAVAIGLWAAAATAAARHLTLTPRVRAAHLVLGAVIPAAVSMTVITAGIWWLASQSSVTLLVLAVTNLALTSVHAPGRIGRAVRQGRRLQAAARGAAALPRFVGVERIAVAAAGLLLPEGFSRYRPEPGYRSGCGQGPAGGDPGPVPLGGPGRQQDRERGVEGSAGDRARGQPLRVAQARPHAEGHL